MSALATLDELKARLDWTLDADEERIGESALEDASELARHHGNSNWLSAATVPPMVRTLVLRASARYMQNPNGYTQSRAGDETLAWSDRDSNMGSVHFNDAEIKLLEDMGGGANRRMLSVPLFAYNNKPANTVQGYVPVNYVGGKPFPMFTNDEDPW